MTTADAYSLSATQEPDLWFALIEGLDPRVTVTHIVTAAQETAMACAAYTMGPDSRRIRVFLSPQQSQVAHWVRWLTDTTDEHNARMRRLALRLACTRCVQYGLPAHGILKDAQGLHRGVSY